MFEDGEEEECWIDANLQMRLGMQAFLLRNNTIKLMEEERAGITR